MKEEASLWSKRWSTAKGWHWKFERMVNIENAQDYVKAFSKLEPEITFSISKRKPKIKK